MSTTRNLFCAYISSRSALVGTLSLCKVCKKEDDEIGVFSATCSSTPVNSKVRL